MRTAAAIITILTALVLADAAHAAPPALVSVEQNERHPSATLQAAGADSVMIYFSTSPDRSTDGSFLDVNVEDLDILTDEEIQSGRWSSESQLDPGTYYVLLRASDFDFDCGDACVEGFSAMHTLTVPEPTPRYSRSVTVYRYLSGVDLSLTVTPLGEDRPYRVCWTRARKPRKCVRGNVEGYSWNESATDTIEVRKRGMRRRTTFSWYVNGRKVASKRVRIPRA